MNLYQGSCNEHGDDADDSNLCDGEKCSKDKVCRSSCCLGYTDTKNGVCFNTDVLPCKQLDNGSDCSSGKECISG